ncbi:MAG: ABC transporter ATP-binding protein [Actinomycetota bacterium]|nr:ABC transporter ATP-binding protein [Actinomycetota bacterium]
MLSIDVRLRRDRFELVGCLEVSPGETIAILGPNGAGKTTLVEILAGLLRIDSGTLSFEGEMFDDGTTTFVPPNGRPIGMVFQDTLLFPHLSVSRNVAFPLRARGIARSTAEQAAMGILDHLGAAHLSDRRPRQLSGGEAQRVSLARALVAEPKILLLDEPTASLDVASKGEVRSTLGSVLSEFDGTALLVSHDPVDALTLADRIVVMEDGAITQVGSPDEIRDAPKTPYAAELVGLNLFRGQLRVLEPGVGQIETGRGDVVVAIGADRSGGEVLGLLHPSDVSIHLNEPEGSPRNVVRGPISSIDLGGDRARVRIASTPELVAEVTLGSLSRLGLHPGQTVWASFKAVEVRVVSA